MINRATGEVDFTSGLRIPAHCPVQTLLANPAVLLKPRIQNLSIKGWQRLVLGFYNSEHGIFEVEALAAEDDRIHVVLLSHKHAFYQPGTPGDAERRAFHEEVISSDLAGQREFAWGEVICRLESTTTKDWLVIAYSREAHVPLETEEVLLHLRAREDLPEAGI